MSFTRARTAAAAAAVALLLAACDGEPATGGGATVVDDTEPAAADDTAPEAAEPADDASSTDSAGTRDNPVPVGTTVEVEDWQVTLVEVTVDATDVVMAENEFNDPPVDGRQYVMWRVEATYNGDDSGDPWIDLSWAIVGSAGNTFSTNVDDYCGVIPNALDDQGETFPGGSVTGNVCIAAESDQVEDGTIRLESFLGSDRVFFVLG